MKKYLFLLLCVGLLTSCCPVKHFVSMRSMYYWQTVFHVDSLEQQFLHEHDISCLYVRYFDVVPDDAKGAVPNATISFEDKVPEGVEIVPTIYIVNDCMRQNVDSLPRLILRRILQMNETNDIAGVKEIQIDCDWTMQTQERYFSFMKTLQRLCHESGLQLSTTVRLHQLSLNAPPADRGVLMVYNTGDVTKLDVERPILDVKDVRPYLHSLASYKLGLSAAYPLFTWRVLFRGGKYVGIMHSDDDLPVLSGDTIVVRQPSLDDILQTRNALNEERFDVHQEMILYDLSDKNIQRFNSKDYEKIFVGNK
jgi:hypothetical protein